MQFIAYHDSHGNIIGLAISPEDDATPADVVITMQPDLRRTEVTLPSGVTFDFDNPSSVYEVLDKLKQDYRVDKDSLTRRS